VKVQVAILVMALTAGAVVWWKMSGRASEPRPFPDVPLPFGATVVKQLESLVNLQATRLVIASTAWPAAEVDRYYRGQLTAAHWQERRGEALADTDRRPLTFRRGEWECVVLAFPDPDRRLTQLLVQLRPVGEGQRRRHLTGGAVASRLGGFPVFPGVTGALLIESGGRDGPATVLFESEAALGKVAEFYHRRLSEGERPLPAVAGAVDWASGRYRFRQWSVLLNLCRRPAGGTSVLIMLTPFREEAAEARVGVAACSGGATS
jgi:hypothetical protein